MRIVASIEARMGSSRYPNKMTSNICGKTTLKHVIDRLKLSKLLTDIVLATTVSLNDNILCEIAKTENINYYRGSVDNVYERVGNAHKAMKSNILITVCGDCPMIDPYLIDIAIDKFLKFNFDMVTFKKGNFLPQGLEFHVFSSDVFQKPIESVDEKKYLEHIGLYFIENSEKYNIGYIDELYKKNLNHIRLQFDYNEDLTFLRKIYPLLSSYNQNKFNIYDIIQVIENNPKIKDINSHCLEKPIR